MSRPPVHNFAIVAASAREGGLLLREEEHVPLLCKLGDKDIIT
jgi:hypothetical protein